MNEQTNNNNNNNTCIFNCIYIGLLSTTLFICLIPHIVSGSILFETNDPSESFCAQVYFDSVFFDGIRYRFIIRHNNRQQKLFSIRFSTYNLSFDDYQTETSNDTMTIQTGVYLDQYELYIEFYYRTEMESTFETDQLDQQAYKAYYNTSNRVVYHNRTVRYPFDFCGFRQLDQPCWRRNRSRFNRLFSEQLHNTYTQKQKIFLYITSQRLLWTVLEQNPLIIGWVELNQYNHTYSNRWTYNQIKSNSTHMIVGAFVWNNQIFVVREQISMFGFRFPAEVHRVIDIKKFILDPSYKMSVNKFFNCTQRSTHFFIDIRDEDTVLKNNPDQNWIKLNQTMWIFTIVSLILLSLSIFVICLLIQERYRFVQKMLLKRKEWKSPELFDSVLKLNSSRTSFSSFSLTDTFSTNSTNSISSMTTKNNQLQRQYSLLLSNRSNQSFADLKPKRNRVINYYDV